MKFRNEIENLQKDVEWAKRNMVNVYKIPPDDLLEILIVVDAALKFCEPQKLAERNFSEDRLHEAVAEFIKNKKPSTD